MKFKVSAVLPTPADVYFVERDSSAFRSLVARMSNLESLEMGKTWMNGEAEVYEFITKPDIEKYVPKQFKHFIPGGDLHYTDIITYDPKEIGNSPYRMAVTSVPPIFSSKAEIKSTLTIAKETDETCRQTLEGTIHIRIIGLGPIAERIIVDNLKNVYKGVPKIIERWVAFRNEIMKHPEGREVLVRGRPENTNVPWINDRIRQLLKEGLPDPEMSSETSSQYGPLPGPDDYSTEYSHSRNPSLTDSDMRTFDEEAEEDEDVFFDAREQTSWMDMGDLVAQSHGKDPKLQRQLARDTDMTHQLLNEYQQSGRKLKCVELDDEHVKEAHKPQRPSHDGELEMAQRRFSTTYNQELEDWGKFWEEHEVPQQKQNPHLKARLANLFTIGADAGMFKKKKERKHLVPWIHRKHRKSLSSEPEDPSGALDEQLSLTDPHHQDGKHLKKHGSKDNDLKKHKSKDVDHDLKKHGSKEHGFFGLGAKDHGSRAASKELEGRASLEETKGHRRSKSGSIVNRMFPPKNKDESH